MKKFLLLLLVMVTVFGIGCSCKDPNPDPDPDKPQTPEEVYMSVKQGSLTYTISKEDMFINLKNTIGLSTAIDWADKLIVTTVGKYALYEELFGSAEGFEDLDKTPYWDLVTDEEIEKAIEEEKYPLGKENYADDEKIIAEKDYLDKLYPLGYRTEEDIKNYYRLVISREKLAKDFQELYYSATDINQGEYQKYYTTYYHEKYNMILLPFATQNSYTKTLKELNIEIKVGENEGQGKWVKADTKEPLTTEEIISAYIQIYNEGHMYRKDATSFLELVEGVDYNLVNGKYEFDLSKENQLYFSKEATRGLDANLRSYITTYLKPYNSESTAEDASWYSAVGKEAGNYYFTMLLLSYEEKDKYEDVKSEIKEALLKKELNDSYIESIFSELRTRFNLVIYDKTIYYNYANTYGVSSIPEIAVENGDILFAFMDTVLLKNDYFNMMDKTFGPYVSSELVNYYNTLYDKEINKVYDLTKEGKESDRITNADAWNYVLEIVSMEKSDFENGVYTPYGYPVSYGWENFMKDVYSVRTEKELAFHYLRENLLFDYLTARYSLAYYSENSLYWKKFESAMQTLANNYFNATGFHFLIGYADENGANVDPKEWTKEQTELVKEFYGLIVEYLFANSESYEGAVELLQFSYKEAPLLVGENKSGELFEGLIDLSKYKTAGVVLVYENLGTFTFEDLNEGLTKAAKELWDINPASETPQVYGRTGNGYKYIESTNGYHVYFNIKNNDMKRHEGRNIPTLEEIKMYLENNETEELTEDQKSMIKNYYDTLYIDLIGIYNSARIAYLGQANYELTFRTNNYTSEEYQKTLAITLKETTDQVNYLID